MSEAPFRSILLLVLRSETPTSEVHKATYRGLEGDCGVLFALTWLSFSDDRECMRDSLCLGFESPGRVCCISTESFDSLPGSQHCFVIWSVFECVFLEHPHLPQ